MADYNHILSVELFSSPDSYYGGTRMLVTADAEGQLKTKIKPINSVPGRLRGEVGVKINFVEEATDIVWTTTIYHHKGQVHTFTEKVESE